jgi:hypothetical protein
MMVVMSIAIRFQFCDGKDTKKAGSRRGEPAGCGSK